MKYLVKEISAHKYPIQRIFSDKQRVINHLRLVLNIDEHENLHHSLIEEFEQTGKLDFHVITNVPALFEDTIMHVQVIPLWEV